MSVREYETEEELPETDGLPVGLLVIVGGTQFWKIRAITREWEPCGTPSSLVHLLDVDDEDVDWGDEEEVDWEDPVSEDWQEDAEEMMWDEL